MSARRALAGVACIACAALAACGGMEERYRPLTVGEPVPVVSVRALGSEATPATDSIRLDGSGARLTLVNVWATWCGPCKAELPDLERLHEEYGARGLRVVGVSVDRDDPAAVTAFARERGVRYALAHDPDGRVSEAMQSLGVPESYLVDSSGRLVWRAIGALEPGAGTLRAEIERGLR